jgi:hypothetical protein
MPRQASLNKSGNEENIPSSHDDEKVNAISRGTDTGNLTPEESPVYNLQTFGSFLTDLLLSSEPKKFDCYCTEDIPRCLHCFA